MAVWQNGVPVGQDRNPNGAKSPENVGEPDNQADNSEKGVSSGAIKMLEPLSSGNDFAPSPVNSTSKGIDRSHLSTIDEVLAAKNEGMKKMSLGNGLQANFEEEGLIRFQFRLAQNGHDTTLTLGNSKSMSLDFAREEARKLYDDVQEQRRKNSGSVIVSKAKRINRKNDSGQYSTLRNLNDASLFIQNLFSGSGIEREIRYAIWLQLLIPARLSDLLNTRWSNFTPRIHTSHQRGIFSLEQVNFKMPDKQYKWEIPTTKNRKSPSNNTAAPLRVAFLSSQTVECLEDCRQFSGESDGFIFPSLSNRSRSDCDRDISRTIKAIWSNYHIEPDGFRNLFRSMINELGFYREEFINEIVTNKYRHSWPSDVIFIQQVQFIIEQWGHHLVRIKNEDRARSKLHLSVGPQQS